jgi:hypothetical protein
MIWEGVKWLVYIHGFAYSGVQDAASTGTMICILFLFQQDQDQIKTDQT